MLAASPKPFVLVCEWRRRHVRMKPGGSGTMKARATRLACFACTVDYLLPTIAIAHHGIEAARAAGYFVASKTDGADMRLDAARAFDCFLDCLL